MQQMKTNFRYCIKFYNNSEEINRTTSEINSINWSMNKKTKVTLWFVYFLNAHRRKHVSDVSR